MFLAMVRNHEDDIGSSMKRRELSSLLLCACSTTSRLLFAFEIAILVHSLFDSTTCKQRLLQHQFSSSEEQE